MTVILDTSTTPRADRAELVRATIAETMVPVEISFKGDEPTTVRGAITDFGQLTVCSVHSNAVEVERTPERARDDLPPSIFLGLQMTGSSLIVQGGREAVLTPGDLAFSESTSPYTLVDGDGIRQHFFRVPVDALGLPVDLVRNMSARTMTPQHPVADLAAAYFRRLAARPDIFTVPGAEAVDRAGLDLVRALLTVHAHDVAPAGDSLRATLPLQALEYARANLGDPALNVAKIAAALHVSPRHLYAVLAEHGISPGEWIRTRRLEACRIELSRPQAHLESIDALARRWGFTAPSTFGRQFRAAYGLSPREWRAGERP